MATEINLYATQLLQNMWNILQCYSELGRVFSCFLLISEVAIIDVLIEFQVEIGTYFEISTFSSFELHCTGEIVAKLRKNAVPGLFSSI